MKQIVALLLAAVLIYGLAACGSTATTPATETPKVETTPEPTPEATPEADPKEALQATFKEAIGGSGLTFYKTVRNDNTGKWRCAVIYTGESMVDHALDYYKAYFESDDELHFICNLGTKRTTAIRVLGENLQVDEHEYVDKEEHDAKIMNSGALIQSYWVNIETGEVEALS